MVKEKFKILIMTLSVLTCLFSANSVLGVTDTWDGTVDTSWYTPGGTEYTLTKAEQVAGIADIVNKGNDLSGVTITLGNNINLSGHNWTPIGNATQQLLDADTFEFAGSFNGANYSISGMTIGSLATPYKNSVAGFFGALTGSVKNLTITDSTIYTESVLAWGAYAVNTTER